MGDLGRRLDALERYLAPDEPEPIREYRDRGDGGVEVLTLRGGLVIRRVLLPGGPAHPDSYAARRP